MAFPAITALTAAMLTILFIALTVRVSILRQSEAIALGTGDSQRLQRAVRAQGNLTESLPLFLILVVLLEGTGVSALLSGGIAFIYLVTRLAHAAGISLGGAFVRLRAAGAAGTLICLLAAASALAHRAIAVL